MKLFEVFGLIDIKDDNAAKKLNDIDKKGEGVGNTLKNAGGKVKKAGKVIGTSLVAAGGSMLALANKAAGTADEIHKGSQRMGISMKGYQELDYWASQNGLSQGNMEKALGRLNQRMGMAAEGNDKYSSALQRLGIDMDSVREGTLSTEDAFAQSIQSLSEMTNGQEQAALTSELFGTKLGRELLPSLQDGALSMDDAKAAAAELGIVLEDDAVMAGVAFNDTMDSVKRSLGNVVTEVGVELMPIINTFLEWVIANMPIIKEIVGTAFEFISAAVQLAVEWIQNIIEWFSNLFTSNEETFTGIRDTVVEIITNVVDFLQSAWETIKDLWDNYGQDIFDFAVFYFTQIWETVEVAFEYIRTIIERIMGHVVPWIKEKLDVLAQFWDENGEKIMNAVENAFSFIRGVIEFIMPIVSGIIDGAWSIISAIFDTAIGVIMGLVETFSSLLTGDFEGIKEGLTRIWDSLWEGIKGIVEGAWSLVSGAFSGLWTSISDWFTGLKDDALNWGKNMIDGFIDGIKSKIAAVGDAVSSVASKVGSFLGFSSPADEGEGRHIVTWGANMVDGFLDGVKSQMDEVGEISNSLVGNMKPSADVELISPSSQQTVNQGREIHQTVNIYSPDRLSPSEIARKNKNSLKQLALEW